MPTPSVQQHQRADRTASAPRPARSAPSRSGAARATGCRPGEPPMRRRGASASQQRGCHALHRGVRRALQVQRPGSVARAVRNGASGERRWSDAVSMRWRRPIRRARRRDRPSDRRSRRRLAGRGAARGRRQGGGHRGGDRVGAAGAAASRSGAARDSCRALGPARPRMTARRANPARRLATAGGGGLAAGAAADRGAAISNRSIDRGAAAGLGGATGSPAASVDRAFDASLFRPSTLSRPACSSRVRVSTGHRPAPEMRKARPAASPAGPASPVTSRSRSRCGGFGRNCASSSGGAAFVRGAVALSRSRPRSAALDPAAVVSGEVGRISRDRRVAAGRSGRWARVRRGAARSRRVARTVAASPRRAVDPTT